MLNRHRWGLVVLITVSGLLAACSGSTPSGQQLPTLMELATSTPSIIEMTATPSPQIDTASIMITEPPPPSINTPAATLTPSVIPSNTITPTPTRTPSITPTFTPEPTETPFVGPISLLAQIAAQATVLPPDFFGGQPAASPLVPVPGLPGVSLEATPPPSAQCQYLPPGGFGQLVLDDPSLILLIGCPVGSPPATLVQSSAWQRFERGGMIWLDGSPGTIYVLNSNGTYQRVNDTFIAGVDPEHGSANPPAGLLEPVRGFGKVWRTVPGVRDSLGWAITAESGTTATLLDFAKGRMLYLPGRDDIIVLFHQGDPGIGGWRSVPGGF